MEQEPRITHKLHQLLQNQTSISMFIAAHSGSKVLSSTWRWNQQMHINI